MTVRRYERKPTRIEAVQWTGKNLDEIREAFGEEGIYAPTELNPDCLIITTMHGDATPCRVGDWVIPDGNPKTFYPCKDAVFKATYELVKDDA